MIQPPSAPRFPLQALSIAVATARSNWLALALLTAVSLLPACAADQPAAHPPCVYFDGCPEAGDANGDGAISDASDTTQTVIRVLDFSLDTQKGEVLKGDVTAGKIDQGADKDPAVVGIQVDVSITTENVPDGAAVEVLVDGVVVGPATQILNGNARVNGLTVGCTAADKPISLSVRAIVDKTTGDAAVSKDKSLVVQCGSACKATVDPLPQSCLTQDQDPLTPGFQQTFFVRADQADCTDAYLKISGGAGVPSESQHVLLNGATAVSVVATLAVDDTGLIGVTATVIGVVEDTLHPERGSEESAPVTVTLTTEAPSIVILQPTSTQIKLTDDLDLNTPGIQIALQGMVSSLSSADVNGIELSVDGTVTATTTLQPDGLFLIPLSFSETGTHALQIRATNGCGLQGQKSQSLAVFVDQAALKILAPVQDSVLRVADDLDPLTPDILETTLSVGVTSETAGAELRVFCKPLLTKNYPTTPTASAAYLNTSLSTVDIALSLSVLEFGQEIQCKVEDDSPNQAISPAVSFVAALPPPCLQVVTPASAVTVTSASLDFLLGTTNLDGQMVQAFLTSPGGVPFDPVDLGLPVTNLLGGTLALTEGGVQVPDGTYLLTFQAVDKWGNPAGTSLCSDVTRIVTLDTTPPTLVITLPVKATLTTLDDADTDNAKPGYQTDVEVTITDAASVCLFLDGTLLSCVNGIAEGTSTVSFASVSLQPGENTLSVTGVDNHGNPAASAPLVVTLISDTPIVKFVKPVGSSVVATDAIEVTISVKDPLSGGPVPGATLEVLLRGVALPVSVTDEGDGLYRFQVTGLSEAPTSSLQVGASVSSAPEKIGYSNQITLTFKSVAPTAAFTNLVEGQIFNAASLLCAISKQDCVTTVGAAFTNVEDGSQAALAVNCGAVQLAYTATVTNGSASFVGVSLADQSNCELALAVTDAAAQTATATPVHVSVDRVVPVIGVVTSPPNPNGLILVALNDLDFDPTNGMQVNWVVTVSGLPAGATVTCTVANDLGQAAGSFAATLAAVIPDGTFLPATFGAISLPDGFAIKIACSASDAAANKGSKTFSAQVLSSAPDLSIQAPPPAALSCAVDADCNLGLCESGKCVVPMSKFTNRNVKLSLSGLPDATPTRLCTDTPGIVGPACATTGYVEIVTGTADKTNSLLNLSALADGSYHVMAEAFDSAKNEWMSSLTTTFPGGRDRIFLIDTVAPVVASVSGPNLVGTPKSCLSVAKQSTPDGLAEGGKFPFVVETSNEDATVSLLVNSASAGSVKTVGLSGALIVSLAMEGTISVAAVASDRVGNVSDAVQIATFFVDTAPPVGNFAVPFKSPVAVGDSRDVEVVSVSSDVEGESVVVKDAAIAKATLPFVGGQAAFAHSVFALLTEGTHDLTAELRDHCANLATIGTTPATVIVDTEPPTVALTSPSVGALFTDNDDASPDGGYQVEAKFTTSGATTWTLELGTDCDAGSNTCVGFQQIATGSVTNSGGVEPTQIASVPFGATVHYKFRVTVADAAGNQAQAEVGFDVLLSGCLVKLSGLPANSLVNTQSCPTPGQNCASVSLPLTASYVGPCGTPTAISLRRAGVEVGNVAPTGQSATFNFTVSDGDNTELEAIVLENLSQKGSSGQLGIAADLTNPTIAFAAATVLGSPTVSGTTAMQGLVQDLSAGTADHQAHFQLSLADAHLNGAKLTALDRTTGAGTVTLTNDTVTVPQTLSGATATLDIHYATLTPDTLNTVTATVTDTFGNTATGSIGVTVDWIAPAALTLQDIQAGDVNPRRPFAVLHFDAVGDNGVSGQAASYLVKYSKKAITTQAEFDAACDASALSKFVAVTPAASGASETVTVTGPDNRAPSDLCKFVPLTDNGLTSYHFGVAAKDAAGNVGPMSNIVSTDLIRLRYMKITANGTFSDQVFRARVFGLGDLNGDGFAEVGVGGGASQQFCVLYGRADMSNIVLANEPPASLQCFANPGGLAGAVGRPADVNGDGITDLVLGAKLGSGIAREVRVYLGNKNAQLSATPAVTITGATATAATQGVSRLATVGNFNGDVSATSLPVMDIAFTSQRSAAFPSSEVVHLIPGNTAWSNASPLTIDVTSQTDRTNNNILRVYAVDEPNVSSFFGAWLGGGNVLTENAGVGQQYDELIITQQSGPQQLVVVKGEELTGGEDIVLTVAGINGTQAGDAKTIRISPAATGQQAFGARFDVLEYDNQPGADIVASHVTLLPADQPGFYLIPGGPALEAYLTPGVGPRIFLDVTAAVAGTTTWFLTKNGLMQNVYLTGPQNIGNFFDDPAAGNHPTVLYARPVSNLVTGGGQQLIFRMPLAQSALGDKVGFLHEDVVVTDVFVPTNPSFGVGGGSAFGMGYGGIGDFNGDGLPDVIVGSGDTNGNPGSTLVIY